MSTVLPNEPNKHERDKLAKKPDVVPDGSFDDLADKRDETHDQVVDLTLEGLELGEDDLVLGDPNDTDVVNENDLDGTQLVTEADRIELGSYADPERGFALEDEQDSNDLILLDLNENDSDSLVAPIASAPTGTPRTSSNIAPNRAPTTASSHANIVPSGPQNPNAGHNTPGGPNHPPANAGGHGPIQPPNAPPGGGGGGGGGHPPHGPNQPHDDSNDGGIPEWMRSSNMQKRWIPTSVVTGVASGLGSYFSYGAASAAAAVGGSATLNAIPLVGPVLGAAWMAGRRYALPPFYRHRVEREFTESLLTTSEQELLRTTRRAFIGHFDTTPAIDARAQNIEQLMEQAGATFDLEVTPRFRDPTQYAHHCYNIYISLCELAGNNPHQPPRGVPITAWHTLARFQTGGLSEADAAGFQDRLTRLSARKGQELRDAHQENPQRFSRVRNLFNGLRAQEENTDQVFTRNILGRDPRRTERLANDNLARYVTQKDEALVNGNGKRRLDELQDGGAIDPFQCPLLGTNEAYAQWCYARFSEFCVRASRDRDNPPPGVELGDWQYFAQLHQLGISDTTRAEVRDQLLRLSAAYGRSIADLHRKMSDCYTLPTVLAGGAASALLGAGIAWSALPVAGFAFASWASRRIKDAPSDIFEINPVNGRMRDPKNIIETIYEGARDVAGVTGRVNQFRKDMSSLASGHGHGEHYKDSDLEDAEKDLNTKKGEMDDLKFTMQITPEAQRPALHQEILEKRKEVRTAQEKYDKIKKALKKQKEEHEKSEKGIWNNIKKTIKTAATEGVTRLSVTGTGAGLLGLGGFALGNASAILPTMPTTLGLGGLGAVLGWKLGGYIFKTYAGKKGDKGGDHH